MLVAVQREGCGASDCAPAVGHQGGVLRWRRRRVCHSLGLLAQAHSAWDRAVEPMAKRQRGADSDDEGASSADEEGEDGSM
jgi:hypothetical protein